MPFNTELISWTAVTLVIELGANYLIRSGQVLPGGVLYGTTAYTFRRSMLAEHSGASLAASNALWDATSTIVNTGLGVLAFGERLTPNKTLGIGLAITGAVLLSLED